MNLEKRIFDFCLWFLAVVCLLVLLSSCSAAVPLPTTPTREVTAMAQPTATDTVATVEQEPVTPNSQTCTVQTGVPSGYLNLRTGAGTQYAVIRVLNEGESLTVTKFGAWLEVSDQQGNQGYVNSHYCK